MVEKDEGLKRTIGLWGLSANIVNIVVGAGIFVIPALIAETMGSASLIAYLICGILISLIMLCFAEAGSKVTNSGGGYTYVETAFGKYPGFLVAVFYIVGGILADATVANALVDIVGSSFPVFAGEKMRLLFLFLIFGFLAFINVIGIKQGIGLVKLLTVGKLFPLLVLIIFGWKDVSISNLAFESGIGLKDLGEACLLLFFAFQGGDVALIVGGEIKNPSRNIPKGIFIGIGGVLVVYMFIQTITQGVLGDQLQYFQEAPLAETAKVVFGSIGFTLLFVGAAISMFGNLSGEVLNISRMLFSVSRDRVIPTAFFSKIHHQYLTPYVAIITYAFAGFIIASIGGFRALINIATAALLINYLGVVLSVIQLRRIKKASPKEFTIPGGITVPIISALIILYFLSNLQMHEIYGFLIFTAIMSFIYMILRWIRKKRIANN